MMKIKTNIVLVCNLFILLTLQTRAEIVYHEHATFELQKNEKIVFMNETYVEIDILEDESDDFEEPPIKEAPISSPHRNLFEQFNVERLKSN